MRRIPGIALALTLGVSGSLAADGVETLSGSRESMTHQNRIAKENDFSFLRTRAQVVKLVAGGALVPLTGNADYALSKVSYPYARPVLKTFVERLGTQYREACGQRLVVTSLTRPVAEQPRNASPLSVHPAGMAVDLRIPASASCQRWLEETLLSLEARGLLDVTREQRPPHYHVAVFPEQYGVYAADQMAREEAEAAAARAAIVELPSVDRPVPTAPVPDSAGIRGPGVFLSVLLALLAVMGGTTAMVRINARGSQD